jgi:hypothetical protein
MTKTDALVLAGDAAEMLERYGLVACGRRKDGETHLDLWTRDGRSYQLAVSGEERLDELVARCLEIAKVQIVAQAPEGLLS